MDSLKLRINLNLLHSPYRIINSSTSITPRKMVRKKKMKIMRKVKILIKNSLMKMMEI